MNEEQAIDNLKNYIECLMEDYGYYKDIVEFRDSVEYLEKRLQTQQSEIEKKDKEIQFQKEINKTEQDRHKQTEKSLKGQLHKKDKMIDEMAISLYGYANLEVVINCPAEYDENYDLSKCRMNLADRNCINCIKQYFEKKAEGK